MKSLYEPADVEAGIRPASKATSWRPAGSRLTGSRRWLPLLSVVPMRDPQIVEPASDIFQRLAPALLMLALGAIDLSGASPIVLSRARVETTKGSGDWQVVERNVELNPKKTAIVICDMWNEHWCKGATRRVAEMAPRMNEVVKKAREQGILIIHCPSDTMKFYEGTPGRKLAQAAPQVEPKVPLQRWCSLDKSREAPLPIDDADGGCDDWPQCKHPPYPWTHQIDTIEIKEGDAITDSAEAYYLMQQRGIDNVIVMGVHLNMCVLGRPFSIRQMVSQGKAVFLMRDLTDTMYNSRARPYVPHCIGTELMIDHVERYWCPTIASTTFLGGREFRFSEDKRARIVLLIGEDEYKTWETLPAFVKETLAWRGFQISVIQQSESDHHKFPGLVDALRDADLLWVSVRRRALPQEQLEAVRAHLDAGKPLIGIRTASHAFAPRNQDAARGAAWLTFDPDVLGGHYTGHYGNDDKTTIITASSAENDALLAGVDATAITGHGSLYKVSPLKADAHVILTGRIPGQLEEPVAWTRRYGPGRARVFYTSLGHPEDFENPAFKRLLLNAVFWALGQPVPPAPADLKRP